MPLKKGIHHTLSMPNDTANTARRYVAGQFVLIAIFAAAAIFDPGFQDVTWPAAMRFCGLALCAVGLAIGAAALAAMGRVMQVSPEPKAEGHLVTSGPYRLLRHPMYTAIVLVVVGLWLRRPAVTVAIAGAALIVLLVRKARFEEGLLQSRYPEYAGYRTRTWGVVPGAGRVRRRTDAGT